jgi:hypothetical protein
MSDILINNCSNIHSQYTIMKEDALLVKIAAGDTESYTIRIQALDTISDKNTLGFLAENAKDDWIRLEAAIRIKNKQVLNKLKLSNDERIKLDAAINLNDQELLTDIVLNSKDDLHREIARNYIDDERQLRKIAEESISENDRVEAAIQLEDAHLCKQLIDLITDDRLKERLAQAIGNGIHTSAHHFTGEKEKAHTATSRGLDEGGLDID